MSLYNKIKNKEARIGVIGLGYVGLPLAVEFAKTGFNVTGIEVDTIKLRTTKITKERTTPIPEYNQTNDLLLAKFSFLEDMIFNKFLCPFGLDYDTG